MREVFVSILTILAIFATVKCSDIGKDGFNFYKDYLRGRSDYPVEEPVSVERMLYFYRTPLQLNPGLLPALEQEYKKRTANAFKNHILNKDLWTEEETPKKRSSKAGLALLMQNKQPYYVDVNHYCLFGK